MRVLVTGATGFLGTHVVPQLVAASHSVTTHGRQDVSVGQDVTHVRGDLSDPDAAARILGAGWDAVVNLAGPVTGGNEDLQRGIDVITEHVTIALHVRRHCSAARIVHASSMAVYGLPETIPVTEEHPRRPRHLYGLAKRLADDVLLSDPQLDVWVVRLPGLFSATRASGALYHFCRAARRGEALRITATEPTVWEILHVEDAASAIVAAVSARARRGGAINVGYGEPIELAAIAKRVVQIAGTGSTVEAGAIAHPLFQLSIERARSILGWHPPSLEDRLTQLYREYGA